MIKVMLFKEILGTINSLRFMLTLILTVTVFTASAFLFIKKYDQRIVDFQELELKRNENLQDNARHLNKLARNDQSLIRKPKITELIASGDEKNLPNSVQFDAFSIDDYANMNRMNYKLNSFLDMDWIFIVGLIFSFLALVLTFDRISGEKESGTLRLQCANSISRLKIISAKYLSYMIILGLVLLIGLVMNLIIVSITLKIVSSPGFILQLLITFVLFMIYLSLFLLIGLFISSQVQKSATSLALSLLLWTLIVILIPAGGSMIAPKIKKIPSSYEHNQLRRAAQTEIWDNAPKGAGGYWGTPEYPYMKERCELINTLDANRDEYRYIRFNDLLSQVKTAQNLTRLSPYSLLNYTGVAIAGTGLNAFVDFYERVRIYRLTFRDFIEQKDKEDKESYHYINSWHPEGFSSKPVEIQQIPKFNEPGYSIGVAMGQAKLDIILLILFNLIGFVLAFGAFVRYDVR